MFVQNPKNTDWATRLKVITRKGQKVLVIEDLISTGKSSLQVVDVLKAAGLEVIGMVGIFTYGFDVAVKAFAAANVPL